MIRENLSIVNRESKYKCKKKHENNPKGWKVFMEKTQKNPFVKDMLYKKYNGKCQFCGKELKENWVLYHGSYDEECICPEKMIKVAHPNPSSPNGTMKVPDCENCSRVEEFTKKLYPVCKLCCYNLSLSVNIYPPKTDKIYNYEWIASHLKKPL